MKHIVHCITLLTLVLLSSEALADTNRVSGYTLDIEFAPLQSHMSGQANIRFDGPLEKGSTVFYLHGELEVESLSLDSKALDFKTEQVLYDSDYSLVADKVTFELDERVENAELTVIYQGYFNPSAARSPSDYMRIDVEGVFLRSYGYSLWFPVFLAADEDVHEVDFPSVRFKLPRQYQLVFVGERISEQLTPEHTITTWRVDNARLSDLQVTAREYQQLRSGNTTIYHLNSDESRLAAKAVVDFTSRLLSYYTDHYRQDPGLGHFNLLEMPKYGDISSHNMVGVSSDTFHSFESAVYAKRTIAHEFVHPFVSLHPSRSDALWSLAIEGFPSYFHLPALRGIYGQEFYDDFMFKVQAYYLKNKGVDKDRWDNTRPPEVPLLKITADRMSEYKDDYVLWGRTKLFFNYLLREMGEEAFSAFARDLFAHLQLTEMDFVELCTKYLPGKETQINTWLYSNEFPDEFKLK